jgi:predicted metal-dependent phosphoesterase TrpH
MIDLHCHTNCSDGIYTPIELLKKANEKGITILSITDHDTINAYYELDKVNIKDYFSGRIIVGAEFNCRFDNCKIELLGYNFDRESIKKWIDSLPTKKKRLELEFKTLVRNCIKKGIKITKGLKYNDRNKYPSEIVFYDLKKYEENKNKIGEEVWNDLPLFYRKYTTDKSFLLYSDSYANMEPDAKEVSNLIRKSGGKVFLAHLYVYDMKNHLEFLKKMIEQNILDGVECHYSRFSKGQINTLLNFCAEHNLLISGGSDFHGERIPEIDLGTGFGNLNVNKNDIEKWVN